MALGEKTRRRHVELNMTREELALVAGLCLILIMDIENGASDQYKK